MTILSEEHSANYFNLLPNILHKYLEEKTITIPTFVQQRTIEPILQGHDLLAKSPTGSGKTLAYLLPIYTKLLKDESTYNDPRVLILVPTRELAQQVANVTKECYKYIALKSVNIIGGENYYTQKKALKQGADIVIGTPGRILDLLQQQSLSLKSLQFFVLDEVDEMLDIGFSEALEAIRKYISEINVQKLFFSATVDKKTAVVVDKFLDKYIKIEVDSKLSSPLAIEHAYIEVQNRSELKALINVLIYFEPTQALIFCSTKQECSDISEELQQRGFNSAMLNGDLTQVNRTTTMNNFKNGKIRFLIATNVAARGIDVQNMPMVINFNVPWNLDHYTHRVGRTGRAGKTGQAITIINSSNAMAYKRLMREAKITPNEIQIPDSRDIVNKVIDFHINELINLSHDEIKSSTKLIKNSIEKLSEIEMRNILTTLLVKKLNKIEVYEKKDIVAHKKYLDWDFYKNKKPLPSKDFSNRNNSFYKNNKNYDLKSSNNNSKNFNKNDKPKHNFAKTGK